MKYCCVGCRYTYDEALGDSIESIEAGTKFYSMQDFFTCPVCWEWSESFEVEKEDIIYVEDISNLDSVEKQHIPSVQILWDSAIVKVWIDEHPMMQEHYIASIGLYDECWDLVEEEFLLPESIPEISFDISSLDDFEIRAKCNLHWIWWIKLER